MHHDEILRKDDVAKLLGVSRRTIDYLIALDAIPHKRLNPTPGGKGCRTIRFSRVAVEAWIQQGCGPCGACLERTACAAE